MFKRFDGYQIIKALAVVQMAILLSIAAYGVYLFKTGQPLIHIVVAVITEMEIRSLFQVIEERISAKSIGW